MIVEAAKMFNDYGWDGIAFAAGMMTASEVQQKLTSIGSWLESTWDRVDAAIQGMIL